MRNIGRLGQVFAILFCPVSYSKFNELKFYQISSLYIQKIDGQNNGNYKIDQNIFILRITIILFLLLIKNTMQ